MCNYFVSFKLCRDIVPSSTDQKISMLISLALILSYIVDETVVGDVGWFSSDPFPSSWNANTFIKPSSRRWVFSFRAPGMDRWGRGNKFRAPEMSNDAMDVGSGWKSVGKTKWSKHGNIKFISTFFCLWKRCWQKNGEL